MVVNVDPESVWNEEKFKKIISPISFVVFSKFLTRIRLVPNETVQNTSWTINEHPVCNKSSPYQWFSFKIMISCLPWVINNFSSCVCELKFQVRVEFGEENKRLNSWIITKSKSFSIHRGWNFVGGCCTKLNFHSPSVASSIPDHSVCGLVKNNLNILQSTNSSLYGHVLRTNVFDFFLNHCLLKSLISSQTCLQFFPSCVQFPFWAC